MDGFGVEREDIAKGLADNVKGLASLSRLTAGAKLGGGLRVRPAGAGAAAVRAKAGQMATAGADRLMNYSGGFKAKPAGDGARAVREFAQHKVINRVANSGAADGVVRQARAAIADRRRSRKYLIAGGAAAAGGAGIGAGTAFGQKMK